MINMKITLFGSAVFIDEVNDVLEIHEWSISV